MQFVFVHNPKFLSLLGTETKFALQEVISMKGNCPNPDAHTKDAD